MHHMYDSLKGKQAHAALIYFYPTEANFKGIYCTTSHRNVLTLVKPYKQVDIWPIDVWIPKECDISLCQVTQVMNNK